MNVCMVKQISSYFRGSKEIEQAGVRRRLLRQPTTLIMGGLVRDFAQNTTLHGLGYIGEKKLTIIEK